MDEWLTKIESGYDRPVAERLGKVLVVALVGFAASLAAEALYDRYTIDRREKNKPVLTAVENINS